MNWLMFAWLLAGIVAIVVLAVWAFNRVRRLDRRQTEPPPVDRVSAEQPFAVSAGFMGRVAAGYLAILAAISGAGLLGYQTFAWFGSGYWPSLSFADTIRGALRFSSPLPALVEWIPIGAVLLVGALACLIFVFHEKD